MAAGDIRMRLTKFEIPNATSAICTGWWELRIESKLGGGHVVMNGATAIDLGLWGVAGKLTLDQVRTQLLAAMAADPTLPARDEVS